MRKSVFWSGKVATIKKDSVKMTLFSQNLFFLCLLIPNYWNLLKICFIHFTTGRQFKERKWVSFYEISKSIIKTLEQMHKEGKPNIPECFQVVLEYILDDLINLS